MAIYHERFLPAGGCKNGRARCGSYSAPFLAHYTLLESPVFLVYCIQIWQSNYKIWSHDTLENTTTFKTNSFYCEKKQSPEFKWQFLQAFIIMFYYYFGLGMLYITWGLIQSQCEIKITKTTNQKGSQNAHLIFTLTHVNVKIR